MHPQTLLPTPLVVQVGPVVATPQSRQVVVGAPQASSVFPALQVPFEQQAPLQAWFALHAVPQVFVAWLHAIPTAQLPKLVQPHAPATHDVPFGFPAQSAHIAPVAPHLVAKFPAMHWLVDASQHPPLHGEVGLQAVVHAFVALSQAWPDGQSSAVLQPHVVPRQALPAIAFEQSTQLPLVPHALVSLPFRQTPSGAQHPAGHDVAVHGFTHFAARTSQTRPFAHCAFELHPHAPPTQPLSSPSQATHALPPVPHCFGLVLLTHVPSGRQHPLQFPQPDVGASALASSGSVGSSSSTPASPVDGGVASVLLHAATSESPRHATKKRKAIDWRKGVLRMENERARRSRPH